MAFGFDFSWYASYIRSVKFGTNNNDTLIGRDAVDRIFAGAGNDIVDGRKSDDYIYGQAGNDTLTGGLGNDFITGGSGNDVIHGYDLNPGANIGVIHHNHRFSKLYSDIIAGNQGDDTIYLDTYDTAYGGSGNDSFHADLTWHSKLYGDDGDDSFNIRAGAATVMDGGAGNDTIVFASAEFGFNLSHKNLTDFAINVYGGDGDDYIENTHEGIYGSGNHTLPVNIHGGNGDDVIYAGGAHETVWGGNGNDRVTGKDGDDIVYGEAGNDLLLGGKGHDVLKGGSGDDHINGDSGKDVIYGGSGNDYIHGGSGRDVIYGGDGEDIIYGGSSGDVHVLHGGFDIIRDWDSRHDKIRIDAKPGETMNNRLNGKLVFSNVERESIKNEHGNYEEIEGLLVTYSEHGVIVGQMVLEDTDWINYSNFEIV